VLTPHDLVLLREALAYWAKNSLGLELTDSANLTKGPVIHIHPVEVAVDDLVALYELLTPENVRYVVVDGDTNHAINTRLFKKVPKIHPGSGRWQVRTLIG
jgi:hypothetical protein